MYIDITEFLNQEEHSINTKGDILSYDFTLRDRLVNQIMMDTFTRLQGMMVYKNTPDTMPEFVIKRNLQLLGFSAGIVAEGKPYIQRCSLGGDGLDPNYLFKKLRVNNPYLETKPEYTIGEDAILIRHDPYMIGLYELVRLYATLIADNEVSIHISQLNERIPALLMGGGTGDGTVKDSFKKALEIFLQKVQKGEFTFVDTSALVKGVDSIPFTQGTSQSATALAQIEREQYLNTVLWHKLGINGNFNMKREAINGNEAGLNDDILELLPDVILDTQRHDFDLFNEMAGLNIEVDLGGPWLRKFYDNIIEGVQNAQTIQTGADSAADEINNDPETPESDEGAEARKDDESPEGSADGAEDQSDDRSEESAGDDTANEIAEEIIEDLAEDMKDDTEENKDDSAD